MIRFFRATIPVIRPDQGGVWLQAYTGFVLGRSRNLFIGKVKNIQVVE